MNIRLLRKPVVFLVFLYGYVYIVTKKYYQPKIKKIMDRAGITLLYIYLIISQIMTLYFWYMWAQNHGFLSSLFIGPLVGEFKGIFFPFFI